MKKDYIFQVSTVDFLLNRNYSGFESIKKLLKHGDFGIGTFSGLDGEMIIHNGKIFQANHTGAINEIKKHGKTPFAVTTFFNPQHNVLIENAGSKEVKTAMLKQFISIELIYAIKIKGLFQMIDLRSGAKQHKPYPDFNTVAKNITQYKLEETEGTIIGFYFPEIYKKISGEGFHFHFIDKKLKTGGHVNDFFIHHATVETEIKTGIKIHLAKPPVI